MRKRWISLTVLLSPRFPGYRTESDVPLYIWRELLKLTFTVSLNNLVFFFTFHKDSESERFFRIECFISNLLLILWAKFYFGIRYRVGIKG